MYYFFSPLTFYEAILFKLLIFLTLVSISVALSLTFTEYTDFIFAQVICDIALFQSACDAENFILCHKSQVA